MREVLKEERGSKMGEGQSDLVGATERNKGERLVKDGRTKQRQVVEEEEDRQE